jgi:hypothetical protein
MLQSHLNAIEELLLAQSKAAVNAGHPNLRGGPREWFIRDFLTTHLPSNLEVGQGEIIDSNSVPNPSPGSYRPQVDIVLYRRDVPKITYSTNNTAYLAEGVIATIECKTNITRTVLGKACKASVVHKALKRETPTMSLVSGWLPFQHIVSYVVAFEGPSRISTVANWLPAVCERLRAEPRSLVEMIVVLGLGVIWRLNAFPGLEIKGRNDGDKWVFIQQRDKNLLLFFLHMLSCVMQLSAPANTSQYIKRAEFPGIKTIKG